jgi:glutamate dehydrogenase
MNGSITPKLSRNGSEHRIRKDTMYVAVPLREVEADAGSGYKSSPFPLKADQQAEVTKILSETGFMPADLVAGEVDWFYGHLGLSNEFL